MNIKIWLLAIRPKTLWASVSPVAVSGALAFNAGSRDVTTFLLILFTAILIQISTNLINDYIDCKKGTDINRIGPTRVTQAGLVSSQQIKIAIIIVNILALLAGLFLVLKGGWPILLIGLAALFCAAWYSIGPFALSYCGLADLFVLIFFGPVATAGTYYLLTGNWEYNALVLGLAPGLISTAVLTANNARDFCSDGAVNKKTLAVRFGLNFAKFEYAFCFLLAVLLPIFLATTAQTSFLLASITVFPFCLVNLRAFIKALSPGDFLPLLAATTKLLPIYTLAFILSLFLFD